jgi:hypothetical protein
MQTEISTNIDAQVRERVQAWLGNAKDFLVSAGIDPAQVMYALWGEQHPLSTLLLSSFIKRVYVLLTKDRIHILRATWLHPWRRVDGKAYRLDELVDLKVSRGFTSETIKMVFADGSKLKVQGVEKGFAEPLQRVKQEGIHVLE